MPDKLRIFPRGLDTELFNPSLRDPKFWQQRGAKGSVMLYVGRISKEKDLNFLAEIMPALREKAGGGAVVQFDVFAIDAHGSVLFRRRRFRGG